VARPPAQAAGQVSPPCHLSPGAAAICGCAVGTIKSRVNRARSKLSALLYVDGAEDFGPDETIRAVIGGSGG